MALFLFPFDKGSSEYLPTAFVVALRPLFPFRQVQYAQVFPLKPAPFCKLFSGLGSTNKSASFLLLLSLCFRHPVLSSIFPSISLADLAETVFFVFLSYQTTESLRTLVSSGNDAADELARRGALLVPSAIPCGLSPLISRIHSYLFSD